MEELLSFFNLLYHKTTKISIVLPQIQKSYLPTKIRVRIYRVKGVSAGRGVFVSDEDFSPCRLQASLTRSTAQMRTPPLASSLGERIREPLTVAIKIGLPARSRPFLLAQEEGFEPPCLLGKRFSRPPRCDRFDIPAYNCNP